MKITVTRQDIQQGQKRDPEQCAVARALLRAGLEHCGVMGPSVMVADRWGRLVSLPLPAGVSDWIFEFDAGKTVRPITFEVDFIPKNDPHHQVGVPLVPSAATPLSLLSTDDLHGVDKLHCSSHYKPAKLPSQKRRRLSLKVRARRRTSAACAVC